MPHRDRPLLWGGCGVIGFAATIGMVRFAGHSPAEATPEVALSSAALAAILAAPGVLTLLARDGRPTLLVPVGVALVPLSFVSFAGITLPLLIPAVLLLVAYGRRRRTQVPPAVPVAVTTVVVLSCLVVALMTLFAHPDPRSYTTATESGGTSDVVTYLESLSAIALVATGILLGESLSRPALTPFWRRAGLGRNRNHAVKQED